MLAIPEDHLGVANDVLSVGVAGDLEFESADVVVAAQRPEVRLLYVQNSLKLAHLKWFDSKHWRQKLLRVHEIFIFPFWTKMVFWNWQLNILNHAKVSDPKKTHLTSHYYFPLLLREFNPCKVQLSQEYFDSNILNILKKITT